MDDIEGQIADSDGIADPHKPRSGSKVLASIPQRFHHRRAARSRNGRLMRAFDFKAEFLRQHVRLPAMIEMAVGNSSFSSSTPVFATASLSLCKSPPGWTEHALIGFGAPEKRAVLLQRGDRDDNRLKRQLRRHTQDVTLDMATMWRCLRACASPSKPPPYPNDTADHVRLGQIAVGP